MTKCYQKEFEIHYYEINRHRQATPLTILNYLEETAIAHSDSVGLGIDKLKTSGLAWILNKWLLNITYYPAWGEKITVETWASKFERFYATREFCIRSADGKIIGAATSRWIFLNINKKRPIRIPQEVINAYGKTSDSLLKSPFIDTDSAGAFTAAKEFSVRKSDIDTNDHVNNARYIEWILETIPAEIDNNYILTDLEIEYKKETKYGAIIKAAAFTAFSGPSSKHFTHLITANGNENSLAAAKTIWQKRK